MRLGSAFKSVANTAQTLFGDTANITLTLPDGTSSSHDAVIYREKASWRTNSHGEREEVKTRVVQLKPDVDPVPIGSTFTADSLDYTVETANTSPASGAQTLNGVRSAYASVSRPGYYGS